MSNNAANSRPALALYIVIAASVLLLVYVLTTGDAARKTEVFGFLGVPTMPLPYNDLYVPLGWLDCYRAGYPLFHCPVNAMQFNYPLTWLALAPTGWGTKDAVWLGVAVEVVVFASLIPVVLQLPRRLFWPFFVLLLSPPIFLALERCNIDFIILVMMIAAGYGSAAVAFVLIAAAFMLKFYPLGAGAVLLRDRYRNSILWLAGLAAVTVAFVLSPLANLHGVTAYEAQGFRYSYGWRVLPDIIDNILSLHGFHVHNILMGLSFVAMFIVLAAGAIFAVRRPRPVLPWPPHVHRWLQIGLGIYITCFLIGYSYEYRFMFLLPTLPALLFAVVRNGWRSWEGITVVAMIAAFWLTWDFEHLRTAGVQELCCWALFALSVPLLIWSLPEWTVSYFRRGATR